MSPNQNSHPMHNIQKSGSTASGTQFNVYQNSSAGLLSPTGLRQSAV